MRVLQNPTKRSSGLETSLLQSMLVRFIESKAVNFHKQTKDWCCREEITNCASAILESSSDYVGIAISDHSFRFWDQSAVAGPNLHHLKICTKSKNLSSHSAQFSSQNLGRFSPGISLDSAYESNQSYMFQQYPTNEYSLVRVHNLVSLHMCHEQKNNTFQIVYIIA